MMTLFHVKLFLFLAKLNIGQYRYLKISAVSMTIGSYPPIPANAIQLPIVDLHHHYLIPVTRQQ